MTITVAGEQVPSPFERLVTYASDYSGTVRRYDLAEQADAFALSREDVQRTRVIASRISNRELDWLVARGESAPWGQVDPAADLVDADPGEKGGLYDHANTLYEHFRSDAPRNLNIAKISKVLYLKRPALMPILDSHLLGTYRRHARQAALRYPDRGHRRMYWAAIRDDLLHNRERIVALKAACARDDRDEVRRLEQLSDLRILDILTW